MMVLRAAPRSAASISRKASMCRSNAERPFETSLG